MHIRQAKISDVIPYARNPRINAQAVDKVAASIQEFGWQQPIVVDTSNVIIAGHTRLLAAQKLKHTHVPIHIAENLTEAQIRAYRIADNRVSEDSEWDMDMLKIELSDLDDFDLSILGFDDNQLSDILAEPVEGLTDEDAVPEPPEEPITKPGDVWILGNHRLMCGDSISIEAVEQLMDGALADQYITDPPYNVSYTGKTKDALTIQNDTMADGEFKQFLIDAFSAADCVMKQGAVFYIWHADLEGYNFRGACKDIGWTVRQCLIWNKNTMVMGRQDYHWKHEPCLYGWKEGSGHLWATDRAQVTVLDFKRPSRSEHHPTMKPVELIQYQVQNNTKGSDIVLDTFGGSGSTLIACEKTGRHCRTMELDPKYCDVIVKRWEEYTGNKAHLENKTEAA